MDASEDPLSWWVFVFPTGQLVTIHTCNGKEALLLDKMAQERLKHNYKWFAENLFKIVRTDGTISTLMPRPGQAKLYAAIEKQRAAGLPIRIRILKARKIGFSTSAQGILLQRAITRPNHNARTIAHNKETASVLYGIGLAGYSNLPDYDWLKPPIARQNATHNFRFIEFGEPARSKRNAGHNGLNSQLQIDTASNVESGRGLTLHSLHMSETAFWKNQRKKLALMNAVPEDLDTLILDESTPNGFNHWQEDWQAAVDGESSFEAIFAAWWEEPSYALLFQNEDERASFVATIGNGPFGEDEERLVEIFGCTPEQLLWRRRTIADKCEANVELFNQEYPASPEDAFIASGRTVFAKHLIRKLQVAAHKTDPDTPSATRPGPELGVLLQGDTREQMGRSRTYEVAQNALWVPKDATGHGDDFDYWRIWAQPDPDARYVVACDPAGEIVGDPTKTAKFAVEVVDHRTRKQVAELETMVDSDELADMLLLIALYYNQALVAIETNGGYGAAAANRLAFDYWYPFMYAGKRLDTKDETYEKRLGWNTSRTSKSVLEDGARELMRTDTHGISSRVLSDQFFHYVDQGNGKHGAEKGKRVDLLMAWMIAQQVALEEMPRPKMGEIGPVIGQRNYDTRGGY